MSVASVLFIPVFLVAEVSGHLDVSCHVRFVFFIGCPHVKQNTQTKYTGIKSYDGHHIMSRPSGQRVGLTRTPQLAVILKDDSLGDLVYQLHQRVSSVPALRQEKAMLRMLRLKEQRCCRLQTCPCTTTSLL